MYWKSDIGEMFGRLLHASMFPGLRSSPLNSRQGARSLLPYPHHILPSEREAATCKPLSCPLRIDPAALFLPDGHFEILCKAPQNFISAANGSLVLS